LLWVFGKELRAILVVAAPLTRSVKTKRLAQMLATATGIAIDSPQRLRYGSLTPPPNGGLFGAGSHIQNSGVNSSRNIPGSYFPCWMVCGLAARLAERAALKAEAMHVGMTASVKIHHGNSG
jgi:hypothetical protein